LRNKKSVGALAAIAGMSIVLLLSGCGSTRQIDPADTKSWQITGTSWYAFCDGRNAFIWVPSRTDSDPDELEAVVYDHWRCIKTVDINPGSSPSVAPSSKPDADPDGIIDDNDD